MLYRNILIVAISKLKELRVANTKLEALVELLTPS